MALTIFRTAEAVLPPVSSTSICQPKDHKVNAKVRTQWIAATGLNASQRLRVGLLRSRFSAVMLLKDCTVTEIVLKGVDLANNLDYTGLRRTHYIVNYVVGGAHICWKVSYRC
jgi:hypothetical protein